MKPIGALLDELNNVGKRALRENEYIGRDGAIWCKTCNMPKYAETLLSCGEYAMIPVRCACEEQALAKSRQERERIERAQQETRRAAMIPVETYRGYRFENDAGKTPELTSIALRYVGSFERLRQQGRGLVLCGGVGTGKTFLALCIANALIDQGHAVRVVTLAEVVAYATDFENAARHFNRLMSASCIVIDDMGTERGASLGEGKSTQFADEQIFRFVDGCYVRKIPLIVTTNYMKADLQAAARSTDNLTTARIYDRILAMCSTVKVNEFDWREYLAEEGRKKAGAVMNRR